MKFNITLLPYQMSFLQNKSKFLWLRAGLGAGKSFVLSHYIIGRMLDNPETLGLVCAATNAQLRDTILAELFRQLALLGLHYDYSLQTGYITLACNGARVKAFSLENYEVLRGIEVGWIAIDEACLAREAAYNVAIGRLRCTKSKRLEVRITSTPRGYDYLYDRYYGDLWTEEHDEIHATAYANYFLPPGYIDSLKALYSPKMFLQEVMAEFVSNAEGNVYHAFDRKEHVRATLQIPGRNIYTGMDYNVNPMTSVFANMYNGTLYVFGETYLKNANTFMMRENMRERFPKDNFVVTPDATGGARKTSSAQSDHEILRSAGFTVKTSKRNPPVEDRYNTVNGRLREGRIQIDPSCEMLIRDLERVTYDDNPEYLTHISDALGYLAWHLFPIKKVRPISQVRSL